MTKAHNGSRQGLTIVVGADDAGVGYKDELAAVLRQDPRVAQVIDVGVTPDGHTAYPKVAITASQQVAEGKADRALLVCGTGLGMAITANKTPGVRAVTAHDIYSVERSVLSNNAQVLTLGQRVIGLELAKTLVDRWLDLDFDEGSASAEKVALIDKYDHDHDTAGEASVGGCADDADGADPAPQSRTVTVGSQSGLHARPAKIFAQKAKETGLDVRIRKGESGDVPANSVLAVMSIGAFKGDEVTITVVGTDAGAVADELAALVASNLDEA